MIEIADFKPFLLYYMLYRYLLSTLEVHVCTSAVDTTLKSVLFTQQIQTLESLLISYYGALASDARRYRVLIHKRLWYHKFHTLLDSS